MFGLTDGEILAGPVLDCPGGAGSFAAEVRLYPLIDTAYVRHPRIDALRRIVEAEGAATEVRRVDYGFQRGATEVLILRPPRRR